MHGRTVVYFLLMAFVMFWSCPVVCSAADGGAYNFGERTPLNAGLRSAILPGWGQFFNGQSAKGYILVGSAVVSGAAAILMYNKAENTYNEYKDNGRIDGKLYDDYTSQINSANMFVYLYAAVWTFGVVDACVGVPKSEKLSLEIRNQQLCLNYRM
jgi:hypothetical protein